ncbi:MAG: hypothetical protein HQL77_17805 [Magnetococcales bacterium]|nr:hypothetical protein [Magnetococcales bacterium]
MNDKSNQKSANPFQRRGNVDPVMNRQLSSEYHFFRVIGELRYLLGSLVQDATKEECWNEFSERARFYLQDPNLIDRVVAQRLLKDIYSDIMSNQESVRWLEDKFSEMDPDVLGWMKLKEQAENKQLSSKEKMERPGSPGACLVFLELCQECDDKEKTFDALMECAGPGLIRMALGTPAIPPPTGMDARERHMKRVEEDPEYRREMESTMEAIKQAVTADPRFLGALRESLQMTRYIGFPADSTAKEDFAVMREEIDALLHAVETGEITAKNKQ